MVHREIRRRVFRPQVSDDGPQQSDKLLFEHNFFYRQSDLDALRKKTGESAQSSTDESQDDEKDEEQ